VEKGSQLHFSLFSGELGKHHDYKALDEKRRAEGNMLELERDGEMTSSHPKF
jgi:hypothetical protein